MFPGNIDNSFQCGYSHYARRSIDQLGDQPQYSPGIHSESWPDNEGEANVQKKMC
jgi:hypothetical protein